MYARPVRFEDVDVAGIVFFARFFGMCHEALEKLFDDLPGGYVDLINERRIGFPVVHAESDYRAPLRYGDVAEIEAKVARIGNKSVTFSFVVRRARDQVVSAELKHVTAVTDLRVMKAITVPTEVRAVLEKHLVTT